MRHDLERVVEVPNRVVILLGGHGRLALRHELGVVGLPLLFFFFLARFSFPAGLGVGVGLLDFVCVCKRLTLPLGRGRVTRNQLQDLAVGFRRLVVMLVGHRRLGLLHEAVVLGGALLLSVLAAH